MEYSGGFPVTVKRSEVVAAVVAPEQWLPLSNLDLLLPPLDYGFLFCYKKGRFDRQKLSPEKAVALLKESLAEALLSFYPLAGEIVCNRDGEPEILCNNKGVDFRHAYADVELKDIDFYRADASIHGKLVPIKTHGRVLSVQVTELKCGGLVLGCTFDHRAADNHSAKMFLSAWAQIAQAKPITLLPSFRRSLLNPRRPPQPHTSFDQLYTPLLSMPPPPSAADDHFVTRMYYVRSGDIDHLQSEATSNGGRKSKLESFCAFLWKTMAAAAADRSKTMKLGIVVDGRARLGAEATSFESYFGNVLSIPFVEATVGGLQTASIGGVAEMVHGCIGMASTEEHFLGLVDWVEARRPKATAAKAYVGGDDEKEEAAVVVSSWQRFTVMHDLDFGWGGPDFSACDFPWGGRTGIVMPMVSPSVDGDWMVYMHVKEKLLDMLEARAAHVFRPLTCHYLKLG